MATPKNNNNTKLTVAWLGPSSVGKTSLITVMYKSLNEITTATDLELSTDPESEKILEEHYKDLTQLVEKFDASNRGMKGTEDSRNFDFTLERKDWLGKRNSLGLEFIDVPGGWSSQKNASPQKYDDYVKLVANSGAVVITIDTLALMYGGGRFHTQVNQVEEITQIVETAYANLSDPRLVIFAPVKCETFLQPGKDPKEIEKAIKRGYDKLMTKVLLPKVKNVAVVITPVETVGCVVCGSWEENDQGDLKIWYLHKLTVDAPMQTRYADQPLRYLLLFLLKQYMDGQKGNVWYKINDFLSRNDDLKEALRKFALGRRLVTPFEILQGHDLLKI